MCGKKRGRSVGHFSVTRLFLMLCGASRASRRLLASARSARSLCVLRPDHGASAELSEDMSPHQWQELQAAGKQPPLRFPVGTPVKCFVGHDEWLTGTVVAHNYREPSWPEAQLSAPYQVLLDPADKGAAIWAPADVNDIIRSNFRFALGSTAEARVSQDEWVRCTVVGYLYRETKWPEGQYAPYQVKITGTLPGPVDERVEELAASAAMIWLPQDSPESIRSVSEERAERLEALVKLRGSGVLGDDEYRERRKEIIHAHFHGPDCAHDHSHGHSH